MEWKLFLQDSARLIITRAVFTPHWAGLSEQFRDTLTTNNNMSLSAFFKQNDRAECPLKTFADLAAELLVMMPVDPRGLMRSFA